MVGLWFAAAAVDSPFVPTEAGASRVSCYPLPACSFHLLPAARLVVKFNHPSTHRLKQFFVLSGSRLEAGPSI